MTIKKMVPPGRLAVAWLTTFLVGTELFVFSPLLPMLIEYYHISAAVAGLSVTIFSSAYMVSAPLFGHLSDRIGPRRVLIGSLFAFGAANFFTASAVNLPSLLAVRLFAGAAAAGVSPSIYALVGGAAPPDRRATWLAFTVSGLLIALAIGASSGALIGTTFGWAPMFISLGAFSWVLVWLNGRLWPCDRQFAVVAKASAQHPLAAAALARRLMPMVLWSTGLYSVYTYLGVGLIAVGFSTGQTAQAILFYGCGAIAGVVVGGHVADRCGTKFTTVASLAGLCACLFLVRFALDTGSLVEPALGLSSAVAQLFFPAQQAGLANAFSGRRGTALAWNNSALFLGISLGSLVGGQAVSNGNFDANLMIAAGIALIGCFMNAFLVPGPARTPAGSVENPK